MSIKSNKNSEDVELIEILQIIWNGKFKIVIAIIISIIFAFLLQSTPESNIKNFTASTQVNSINSLQENEYNFLNKAINEMTPIEAPLKNKYSRESLLINFIEIINDKKLFAEGIRKFQLLDASQYINEQEYNEAISNFAASIDILPNNSPNIGKQIWQYAFTIKVEYNDEKKWKDVLNFVNEEANKLIKDKLSNHFNLLIATKKQNMNFKIEDLSTRIKNLKKDYERDTQNKISYLKEQSEIAKKLNIKEFSFTSQSVDIYQSTNLPYASTHPLYLRGYEAIDKEIELMESRKNPEAFIKELPLLERAIRKIKQDKFIERATIIYEKSPIAENNQFIAAIIKSTNTQFMYPKKIDNNKKRTIALAILAGMLVGVFYVLVTNSYLAREIAKKK
jgi:LPS O-antigen subunit length determinant protein (WzzB/FepE family)